MQDLTALTCDDRVEVVHVLSHVSVAGELGIGLAEHHAVDAQARAHLHRT